MNLPLEGIRVIDLGQIYAVPYCTLQMAYLGAEIIKIEPPTTGESLRRHDVSRGGVNYAFLMLNANKKSVALNLKHLRGREILLGLLASADVLTENYAGGVMESLGLAYEQIASRFPRLIYASASGYGANSRWSRLGAMDYTVQAASGFMMVTGSADSPPMRTAATFIDMGTGAHLLAGIMAALMQRERTGRGQKVEVAMRDVAIPGLTTAIGSLLDGRTPVRMGNRHPNACPCNTYPATDGSVLIFCLTEKHWQTLLKVLGREDLAADERFGNHAARHKIADEVDVMIGAWTRTSSRDEIIAVMMEEGIPCAPVRSVAEAIDDPDISERAIMIETDYPTRGAVKVLGPPIKLSGSRTGERVKSRPPMIGENTAEVLAELGIGADQLDNLRRDGVI